MANEVGDAARTEIEKVVADCAARGRIAQFEAGKGEKPVIRADFLEDLALDQPARGIRIRGVRVDGAVDLSFATLAALVLEDCELPEKLDVTGARLGRLSINGSRFSHLVARGATIAGGLNFGNAGPFDETGWIDAGRATIRGGVDGCGAQLKSPPPRPKEDVLAWEHNYALRLSETDIQGNVVLNAVFNGPNPPPDKAFVADGGICLDDAHIQGSLWLRGAEVIAGEGDIYHPADALHAHAVVIDGFMGINFGFHTKGRVWLQGARIRERLSIGVEYENRMEKVDELYDWGGRLMNQTVLLHLDQAEIGGSLLIGPVVIEGAIGMAYTQVRRGVSIHGQIKNKSPDGMAFAINARGAQVGGDFLVNRSLLAEGRISLANATIDGCFNATGATLDNQTEDGRGTALDFENAQVSRGCLPLGLETGDAPGVSILGRVNFANARTNTD
jgi:hypothetical protein